MKRPSLFLEKFDSLDETMTRPLRLPAGRGVLQAIGLGLAHSGDIFYWAALLAAAWFLGDAYWKARAIIFFAGLALTEVATVGIKMILRRNRPAGSAGAIYRKYDPYSFPSGHAARATMLCILSFLTGPMEAFIAIMIWSPFMVMARIAIGIHYVFDVLAGIVLGALLTVGLWQVFPLIVARLTVL